MSVTMESAVFMGKNFQNNQNSIVNTADLTLKQMFDISIKLVGRTRGDLRFGNDSLGKTLMEINVNNWWRKNHQSSTHEGPRLFRFCSVLEGSIKIQNPTKLGRKGLDGSHLLKATETLTESVESRLNASGTSSQVSIRCSSMVKSKITEQIRRNTRKFHRKISFHVDVQRHFLWNERQ